MMIERRQREEFFPQNRRQLNLKKRNLKETESISKSNCVFKNDILYVFKSSQILKHNFPILHARTCKHIWLRGFSKIRFCIFLSHQKYLNMLFPLRTHWHAIGRICNCVGYTPEWQSDFSWISKRNPNEIYNSRADHVCRFYVLFVLFALKK